MFTDRVTLKLIAGKGGNGAVAWRREKYIPKGGPTGGNGGDGGSVIIRTSPHLYSLERYRNKKVLRAGNAEAGGANRKTGKNGHTEVVEVPCGTLVKDVETGEVLHDLTEEGTEIVICQGGKGGRGNESFKTPTNQAPNKFTEGTFGEAKDVEFELKLIAEVGLVGFPNAGKSTLISNVAKVRVKIAPYPFTTLKPNLGFIEFDDYSRIFIADIPGIIQGAHENKGLGFEFLKHIERTKVLLFMLDASGVDGRDPWEDFEVLRNEVGTYQAELLERPYIVALNKIDSPESDEKIAEFHSRSEGVNAKIFEISAELGEGVGPLVEEMRTLAQVDGKRFY
jgi:GTP-binding protein